MGYKLAFIDRQFGTSTALNKLNDIIDTKIKENENLSQDLINIDAMIDSPSFSLTNVQHNELFNVLSLDDGKKPETKPTRNAYECVTCQYKVHGKPQLSITCNHCGNDLKELIY